MTETDRGGCAGGDRPRPSGCRRRRGADNAAGESGFRIWSTTTPCACDPHVTNDPAVITPEAATCLLADVGPHRRIHAEMVKRFAREMTAGRWRDAEAVVTLDPKTGRLLDGVHVLHAVVSSGTSITVRVTLGTNPL